MVPSRSRVRKIVIDGRSEPELLRMVRGHYDSEPLMRLEGEIHFDAALSRAEVEAAALVYGRPMASAAYLPCCGTLRHVPALLERCAGEPRDGCVARAGPAAARDARLCIRGVTPVPTIDRSPRRPP
jgi:hypothetical protein